MLLVAGSLARLEHSVPQRVRHSSRVGGDLAGTGALTSCRSQAEEWRASLPALQGAFPAWAMLFPASSRAETFVFAVPFCYSQAKISRTSV